MDKGTNNYWHARIELISLVYKNEKCSNIISVIKTAEYQLIVVRLDYSQYQPNN